MIWRVMKNMAGTNTLTRTKFALILTSFPLFPLQCQCAFTLDTSNALIVITDCRLQLITVKKFWGLDTLKTDKIC
jgi:hypothetical protein